MQELKREIRELHRALPTLWTIWSRGTPPLCFHFSNSSFSTKHSGTGPWTRLRTLEKPIQWSHFYCQVQGVVLNPEVQPALATSLSMVPFPCAFSLLLEVLSRYPITLSFDTSLCLCSVAPPWPPISPPLTMPGSGPAPRRLITTRLIAHRSAPCTVAQAWLRLLSAHRSAPCRDTQPQALPSSSIAPPLE